MPHQCTTCNAIYDDGSESILTGCNECNSNKFQFVSEATAADLAQDAAARADAPPVADPTTNRASTPPTTDDGDVIIGDDHERDHDRDAAGARDGDTSPNQPTGTAPRTAGDTEDPSQAQARSAEFTGTFWETPPAEPEREGESTAEAKAVAGEPEPEPEPDPETDTSGPTAEATREPADDGILVADAAAADTETAPAAEEVHEELNEQFGSIEIVEPGEYNLNLMDLYEQDDYIISLESDGKYVVKPVNERHSPSSTS